MANEQTGIQESYEPAYGQRFRILVDKVARKWQQLSFKTAAEDVYFLHNESESLPSVVGLTYTSTLAPGETEIDIPISGGFTADSKIDIYTSVFGLSPTSVELHDRTNIITLGFPPQSDYVDIKIVVGAFVDATLAVY